jgi:hypothetical protein
MPDMMEAFFYTLGDAVVAPSVGHAELVLAFLMCIAFTAMAVKTFLDRGTDPDRGQPRF